MQSKKLQNDLVRFQGKPLNITVFQVMPQAVMLEKLKLNGSMKTYPALRA